MGKPEEKEIEVNITLKGKQRVMEFSALIEIVLKATGSKLVHICSDLKKEIEHQLKDQVNKNTDDNK